MRALLPFAATSSRCCFCLLDLYGNDSNHNVKLSFCRDLLMTEKNLRTTRRSSAGDRYPWECSLSQSGEYQYTTSLVFDKGPQGTVSKMGYTSIHLACGNGLNLYTPNSGLEYRSLYFMGMEAAECFLTVLHIQHSEAKRKPCFLA